MGDCGLTGRKIIVDTYGGIGSTHGGGASLQVKTRLRLIVQRLMSQQAMWQKILSPPALADRCEIQVSYAIGVAEPTSISLNTFGTGKTW